MQRMDRAERGARGDRQGDQSHDSSADRTDLGEACHADLPPQSEKREAAAAGDAGADRAEAEADQARGDGEDEHDARQVAPRDEADACVHRQQIQVRPERQGDEDADHERTEHRRTSSAYRSPKRNVVRGSPNGTARRTTGSTNMAIHSAERQYEAIEP